MTKAIMLTELSPEQFNNLFDGLRKELAEIKADLQPKQPSKYLTLNEMALFLKASSFQHSEKKKWSKKDRPKKRILLIILYDHQQFSKNSYKMKLKEWWLKLLGIITSPIIAKLISSMIFYLIEYLKERINND